VKSIRRYGSLEALLSCLAAAGLGLSACGGQGDVARAPTPSKVAWNDSGDQAAPAAEAATSADEADEADPAEEVSSASPPGKSQPPVIDLDALPAKAPPAAAPKAVAAKPAESEPVAAEELSEEEPAAPAARPAARAARPAPRAAKPAAPAAEPESPASDPLAAELRKRRAQAKARSEARSEEPAPDARTAPAPPTRPDYGGSDPCRATSFSVPRVREACASGGRTAAKRVMKEAIGKATATGQVLKCSNCHANQSDYTLKSNAAADLERWLGD
jgi:hypothetical protein